MILRVESGRSLASLTSLELGGAAQYFVDARSRDELRAALTHAKNNDLGLRVLGGGSNLVVDDAGISGLVLRVATRGIAEALDTDGLLCVEAGEPFENVVQYAVSEDLAGLECLTGIPGSTGATPIQNVGAYGQEVSDTIVGVEVLERATGTTRWWSNAECEFSYRNSRFKREADRHIVLAVRFQLRRSSAPSLRYAELERALAGIDQPSVRDVAGTVHALRAKKSMLLDPRDPNGRSAGSFFMNPVVGNEAAAQVRARAVALGLVRTADEVPSFPVDSEHVKLSAGFLIERAGIARGTRRGRVGVSTAHALCLVNLGGGTTTELLTLANEVSDAVEKVFSVRLVPEPVMWTDRSDPCAAGPDHA